MALAAERLQLLQQLQQPQRLRQLQRISSFRIVKLCPRLDTISGDLEQFEDSERGHRTD